MNHSTKIPTLVIAIAVVTSFDAGPADPTASAQEKAIKTVSNGEGTLDSPASRPPSSESTDEADRVFAAHKPFDRESYRGQIHIMSTHGDKPVTMPLYVRKEDKTAYNQHAELEVKGDIVLGAMGILGYTDTFLRIRFLKPDGEWHKIKRKAIINGRLVIEIEEHERLYTIHGVRPLYGMIEPGIRLPDVEANRTH